MTEIILQNEQSIFDGATVDQLRIMQKIILEIACKLAPEELRKKIGILKARLADDPRGRELQVFGWLRNAFKSNLEGDGGKAIESFVDNGVSMSKEGKLLVSKRKQQKLQRNLEKILGADVAKATTKDVHDILKAQWKATKSLVKKDAAKYKRSTKAGLTRQDNASIKILNGQNNFFVSGTYDEGMIKKVNTIVAKHVKKGTHISNLARALKKDISSGLTPRADSYYSVLATDVLNRARQFSQVNAYTEARIRRYEIMAVLDERTTEICEAMDGRVFEVEIARKIVRDITSFGIPGTEGAVTKFKALRPWLAFDKNRAAEGEDAISFADAKGKKVYLPDSKFKGNKDGSFKFLGKKSFVNNRQIEEAAPRNSNPPILPPFHANCRTTSVIDENSIKLQEWVSGLDSSGIGVGSALISSAGAEAKIVSIKAGANPKMKITEKPLLKPSITKTKSTSAIGKDYTPAKITIPTKGQTILDKKIVDFPAEISPTSQAIIDNRIYFERGTKAKIQKKYKEAVSTSLKRMPESVTKNLSHFEIADSVEITERGSLAGFYHYNTKNIDLYLKDRYGKRFTVLQIQKNTYHEVGHHVWIDNAEAKIPHKVRKAWREYHKETKRRKGKFITEYAKTNSEEHFCEGFSHWYFNKQTFKKKEPKAFVFFEKHFKSIFEGKGK